MSDNPSLFANHRGIGMKGGTFPDPEPVTEHPHAGVIAATNPDTRSRVARLMDEADAAYDNEDQGWFDRLPESDLAALWGVACAEGASWDDEVFDALDKHDWFDRDVQRA